MAELKVYNKLQSLKRLSKNLWHAACNFLYNMSFAIKTQLIPNIQITDTKQQYFTFLFEILTIKFGYS